DISPPSVSQVVIIKQDSALVNTILLLITVLFHFGPAGAFQAAVLFTVIFQEQEFLFPEHDMIGHAPAVQLFDLFPLDKPADGLPSAAFPAIPVSLRPEIVVSLKRKECGALQVKPEHILSPLSPDRHKVVCTVPEPSDVLR